MKMIRTVFSISKELLTRFDSALLPSQSRSAVIRELIEEFINRQKTDKHHVKKENRSNLK